jgi:hypothetical protein
MNQLAPLHEHFEEWFSTLTPDQQVFVRKTFASIYNVEVSQILSEILFMRDPADLEPEQAGQLMENIEEYVVQGTDQDIIGGHIADIIQGDSTLEEFTDILVKYTEVIEPTNGSTSDYSESAATGDNITVDVWRKKMFEELASDIKEVFPDTANNIILEVQQKRVLLRAEDLESNIHQGATIDFGHQNLH